MSNRLIDLLLDLSPRERWLLLLLFGAVLLVGLVFGMFLPLQEAKREQVSRRAEAVSLNLWVQERVRENALIAKVSETDEGEPIGTSGVEKTLIVAGLRDAITELSGGTDGTIDLRFNSVRFVRFMDWLSQAAPVWRYEIAQFRFEASPEPGNIMATLTLRPQSN